MLTLERLDGRWGEVRNEAATLVLETGIDIMNRFVDEREGFSSERAVPPAVAAQARSPSLLLDPDLQRAYG